MPDTSGLVTVRLVGLPLDVHSRASEHSDELMREFTYLRAQSTDPEAGDVPRRLLELVDEVRMRFNGFTAGTQSELDQALQEGRDRIDLEYVVPAEVADACVRLGELLDEADRYCRSGQHLLTLATTAEGLAYRSWFLEEFIRQAAGEPPRPWSSG